MKRKTPVLYPDHPMYTDAIDALERYHEAQASAGRAAPMSWGFRKTFRPSRG